MFSFFFLLFKVSFPLIARWYPHAKKRALCFFHHSFFPLHALEKAIPVVPSPPFFVYFFFRSRCLGQTGQFPFFSFDLSLSRVRLPPQYRDRNVSLFLMVPFQSFLLFLFPSLSGGNTFSDFPFFSQLSLRSPWLAVFSPPLFTKLSKCNPSLARFALLF